ncbi:MAG: hypothetical protein ACLPN5_02175 [Roseiarcus sp.]
MSVSASFGRGGAQSELSAPSAPIRGRAETFDEIAEAARAAFRRRHDPDLADDDEFGGAQRVCAEDDALRAFVGANWGAYAGLWRDMRATAGFCARFSWVAALAPGVWLLYRKQWLYGAIVLALQAFAAQSRFVLAPAVEVVLATYVGFYGRALVLSAGRRLWEAERRNPGSPAGLRRTMERAGGVSVAGGMLGLVALSALTIQQTLETAQAVLAPAAILGAVVHALP